MKKQTPTAGLLDKRDLNRVAARSIFLQSSWNFERMQGLGYCYSILPCLKKIYRDDPAELNRAVVRNLEFFNTQPYLSTAIMGTTLAMEERRAAKKDVDESAISNVKIALMGPFAGIGDSFFWYTIYPIAISVGCTLAAGGSILGPIFALVFFNFFHLVTRFGGIKKGYSLGLDFMSKIQGSFMSRITQAAGVVGLMVLGVMTVNYVDFSLNLVLGGEGGLDIQASVLDTIMPNLLPLGLVWLVYWLIKKRVSPILIMLGLILFGVLCSLAGIV